MNNSSPNSMDFTNTLTQSGWILKDTGILLGASPLLQHLPTVLLYHSCKWMETHIGLLTKNPIFFEKYPKFWEIHESQRSGKMAFTIGFLTNIATTWLVEAEIVISCFYTGKT